VSPLSTPSGLFCFSHAKWQWSSKWSSDFKSTLHMKHLFNKIFPLFCKLLQVKILECFPNKTRDLESSERIPNKLPCEPMFWKWMTWLRQRDKFHVPRLDCEYPFRVKIPPNWIGNEPIIMFEEIKINLLMHVSVLTKLVEK